MNLHFKAMRYKNLLYTGNQWTELQLDARKMTLIVGQNGSGKSTLLDAICYVLYGKPFRKINKPELLNRANDRELVVEIEFSIEMNEYKVVRGMRPNVFELYKNGEMLNQDAENKDYQAMLEKQILKMSFKTFKQIVILGSAAFTPFMQLSTGDRRDVVEDLLDLQLFSVMNILLKGKIGETDRQINEVEIKKTLLTNTRKLLKEHMAESKEVSEQLIAEKQTRIDAALASIEQTNLKLVDLHRAHQALKDGIADAVSVSKKIDQMKAIKSQLTQKRSISQSEIEFFEKNTVCPTCTQELENTFRGDQVICRHKTIKDVDEALEKLGAMIDESTTRQNDIFKVQREIEQLSREITGLQSEVRAQSQYVQELQTERDKLGARAEAVDEGRLQEIEIQIEEMTSKFNDLHELKKIQTVAAGLLRDSGIKARIIAQYVPVINKLINKNLAQLDFVCNFTLDENFEENIRANGKDGASYNSFSEGEKFRINVAILFTWRALSRLRNNASTNLLIMDEILDGSLDFAGADEFLKVVNQLTDDNSVFIISHRGDTLVDKFPVTLKFEKNHGFSRMKELA